MATHADATAATSTRLRTRTSTSRPSSISAAFALWIVDIFVGASSGVLIVIAAATLPQVTNLPAGESGIAAGVLIALGVAIVAFALLRAFFATKMRDGANWARIVLTVLGALGLSGLAGGLWISWVAAVLTFLAVAAMWVPTSHTYFTAAKRH